MDHAMHVQHDRLISFHAASCRPVAAFDSKGRFGG